jgi:nucleoside-diphosphate kinase
MNNITLTMIKPTAFKKGYAANILAKITDAGFRIQALKMLRLSKSEAEKFYEVHKDRPFYGELTDFMSSGPIIAAILEKENAVADYRTLIGATKPENAEDGTIRKLYATDIQQNAVHGSDSDENAEYEAGFFFAQKERFNKNGEIVS